MLVRRRRRPRPGTARARRTPLSTRPRSSRQEVKQQRVDALGLRRAASSGPRPRCARSATCPSTCALGAVMLCSSRYASPLLQMPSVSACTGGSGARGSSSPRGCRFARYQFSAGGEVEAARGRGPGGSRPTRAAAPQSFASQDLLGLRELEEQHVPGLLALGERARDARVADGQHDEPARRAPGAISAIAQATAAPQSWPTTCAFSISSASSTATMSATLLADPVVARPRRASRTRRSRAGRVQRRGNRRPSGSGSDGATERANPGSRGAGGRRRPRPRRAPRARRRQR